MMIREEKKKGKWERQNPNKGIMYEQKMPKTKTMKVKVKGREERNVSQPPNTKNTDSKFQHKHQILLLCFVFWTLLFFAFCESDIWLVGLDNPFPTFFSSHNPKTKRP